jgi:hypothetical protein
MQSHHFQLNLKAYIMIKFRWQKTDYGYNCWSKKSGANAYVYFGHFRSKKAALDAHAQQQE